jgi:hypothetical protein
MKLVNAFCMAPVISLIAMAALADDAGAPPAGSPIAACKQDVQTLCPNVQPGGGRVMACLKSHAAQVSEDCKAAVKAEHGRHAQQSSGGGPPAAPPGN